MGGWGEKEGEGGREATVPWQGVKSAVHTQESAVPFSLTSTLYPIYPEEHHQPPPGIYGRRSSKALSTIILNVLVRNLASGHRCFVF